MSFIQIGDLVRICYDDQWFDEGEVIDVRDEVITVDFYDWIERWYDDAFILVELFYEGVEVLVPIRVGTIVLDFRMRPVNHTREYRCGESFHAAWWLPECMR